MQPLLSYKKVKEAISMKINNFKTAENSKKLVEWVKALAKPINPPVNMPLQEGMKAFGHTIKHDCVDDKLKIYDKNGQDISNRIELKDVADAAFWLRCLNSKKVHPSWRGYFVDKGTWQ